MNHPELPTVNSTNGQGSNGQTNSSLTTTPLPASKKVYIKGSQPGVAVPMREIALSPPRTIPS